MMIRRLFSRDALGAVAKSALAGSRNDETAPRCAYRGAGGSTPSAHVGSGNSHTFFSVSQMHRSLSVRSGTASTVSPSATVE